MLHTQEVHGSSPCAPTINPFTFSSGNPARNFGHAQFAASLDTFRTPGGHLA